MALKEEFQEKIHFLSFYFQFSKSKTKMTKFNRFFGVRIKISSRKHEGEEF